MKCISRTESPRLPAAGVVRRHSLGAPPSSILPPSPPISDMPKPKAPGKATRRRASLSSSSDDRDSDSGTWTLKCEVCHASGDNLLPEEAEGGLVQCDRCQVWQHTDCWEERDREKRMERDWDLDFYCTRCTRLLKQHPKAPRASVSPPRATRAPTPGGSEDDNPFNSDPEADSQSPLRPARGKADKLKAHSGAVKRERDEDKAKAKTKTNVKPKARAREPAAQRRKKPILSDSEDEFSPERASAPHAASAPRARVPAKTATKKRTRSPSEEDDGPPRKGGKSAPERKSLAAERAQLAKAAEQAGQNRIRQSQEVMKAKQAALEAQQAEAAKKAAQQAKKAAAARRSELLGSLLGGGSKPSSPATSMSTPKPKVTTPLAGDKPSQGAPKGANGAAGPSRAKPDAPAPGGDAPTKVPAKSSLLTAALTGASTASTASTAFGADGISAEEIARMRAASRAAVAAMQKRAVNLLAAGDALQAAERRVMHEASLDPRLQLRSWQFGLSQSLFYKGGPMDPTGPPLEPAPRKAGGTRTPAAIARTPQPHGFARSTPAPVSSRSATKTEPSPPTEAAAADDPKPVPPGVRPVSSKISAISADVRPVSPRLSGSSSPRISAMRRMQT